MKRILFPFIMLFMVGNIIIAQDKHPTLSKSEVEAMTNALSMDSVFSTMVTSAGDPVKLYENFKSNLRIADMLKLKGVQIIGNSGHDSCDSTIAIFRNAFGKSYTDIIVGKSVSLQ